MLEVEVSPLITYMIVFFFFLIDVDIAVAFLSLLDFSSKGNSLLLVSHLTETKKKKKRGGKKKTHTEKRLSSSSLFLPLFYKWNYVRAEALRWCLFSFFFSLLFFFREESRI